MAYTDGINIFIKNSFITHCSNPFTNALATISHYPI